MASNSGSALSRLVGHTPLDEQRTDKEISNNGKSLSSGIINHGASAVLPTVTTVNQPPPPLPPSTISQKPKGNICPRCEKPVYFAEEVKAAGQSFHKLCYKCINCNKSISGANFAVHEGNIYDNTCYKRLFGPKGVGFGMGAGALSTDN